MIVLETLANINKLFNRRNDAIKFVDDYGSIIVEAKAKPAKEPATEPTKGKGLEILTTKQMLQRLLIAK